MAYVVHVTFRIRGQVDNHEYTCDEPPCINMTKSGEHKIANVRFRGKGGRDAKGLVAYAMYNSVEHIIVRLTDN